MDKYKKEMMHNYILRMPTLIEKLMSVLLLIGVVYGCGKLVFTAFDFYSVPFEEYIENLMNTAFSIIIIIEFIRMLIKHSMNTVIEVLIFAIARRLIAGHDEPINSLISIISIAVLLACRKFLFYKFDFEEEI